MKRAFGSPDHREMRCVKNIDGVDLLDTRHADSRGQSPLSDERRESLAGFGLEKLAVLDLLEPGITLKVDNEGQEHRSRDDGSGQASAPYFIDPQDRYARMT